MEESNKWMVCVQCMTYNQAPYIEDALNGFTMQETTFPFVCCVVDDASTDGEPEVIDNYMKEHFDLDDASTVCREKTDDYNILFARNKTNINCYFAVLFLKYNHYKNQEIKLRKLSYISKWIDNAKYLAICEGDDYWISPNKLQKQFLFMQNHPEISLCFHAAKIEKSIEQEPFISCENIESREYSSIELFNKWIAPTNSFFFRTQIQNYITCGNSRILNGDIICILKCAELGKIYGFSDVMSVYRMQANGVTYDEERKKNRIQRYPAHWEFIRDNFHTIPKKDINKKIVNSYYQRFCYDKFLSKQWISDFGKVFLKHPLYFGLYAKRILGKARHLL